MELVPICVGCGLPPFQIMEFIHAQFAERIPFESILIKDYSDTYNIKNKHFICTSCWMRAGCPQGVVA